MIATLVETSHDIRDAYAKTRAAMEKLEYTRGTPLSRGTSLAYKTTLERMFIERDFEPDDKATWPAMVEQVSSFLSDMRNEYDRAYSSAFGDDARERIEQVSGTLESLNDAVRNTVHWGQKPVGYVEDTAEEPEGATSLVEWDNRIKTIYDSTMLAFQAAVPAVEKMRGTQAALAYIRLLEETCTSKNFGYRILLTDKERCVIAEAILTGLFEAYDDMWVECEDSASEDDLLEVKIRVGHLRDAIGDKWRGM